MHIDAYLYFGGRAEEAIDFYRHAIGAKTEMLMRFKEAPDPPPPECCVANWDDKLMHASIVIGDSKVLVSDGTGREPVGFQGFSLTLSVPDAAAADRAFAALGDGGKVTMPLATTFFSPRFGMLTDRFGVAWIVIVPAPM